MSSSVSSRRCIRIVAVFHSVYMSEYMARMHIYTECSVDENSVVRDALLISIFLFQARSNENNKMKMRKAPQAARIAS